MHHQFQMVAALSPNNFLPCPSIHPPLMGDSEDRPCPSRPRAGPQHWLLLPRLISVHQALSHALEVRTGAHGGHCPFGVFAPLEGHSHIHIHSTHTHIYTHIPIHSQFKYSYTYTLTHILFVIHSHTHAHSVTHTHTQTHSYTQTTHRNPTPKYKLFNRASSKVLGEHRVKMK